MQQEKSIAIVGGGPGGLTLARILATRGIRSTVLELDEHSLARPQGGSLDMHAESGQLALREAGLWAEFKALARYDDQYDAIYDHEGMLRFELAEAHAGDRPEIDRAQLRELLLGSLPEGTVRWGSKVSAVEPLPDGRYRIANGHGSLGEFDLVVGADGAWSKVRPLVSSASPRYTGILFIELNISDVDAKHPGIARLIPHGKISAIGKSKAFIAQRSSNGVVRVYLMLRVPEDWIGKGGADLSSPVRARVDLKAQFPGWSPSLLAFIDACDDAIVPRPIVALPVGHRWQHRPGVTLVGDAAHVMPPFSGEGANMAMLDGAELALRLADHVDWSRAVADYEARMFERAAAAAAGAMEGLDFVSDHALDHALEHFRVITAAAAAAGQVAS